MYMRPIIILTGNNGAGKSTVASMLSKRGFREITIAGAIKRFCSELFGLPYEHFDSHEYKDKPIDGKNYTPRDILKFVANDCLGFPLFEKFGIRVFIDIVVRDLMKTNDPVCISDLRHVHESEALKDHPAIHWHIVRDGRHQELDVQRNLDSRLQELNGRQHLDTCNQINNAGSMADLEAKVDDQLAKNGLIVVDTTSDQSESAYCPTQDLVRHTHESRRHCSGGCSPTILSNLSRP